MQVTVEETGAIERKLTISVPSDKMGGEIKTRLARLKKQAKIPGFRPGKAPQGVIDKRYSNQVIGEVMNDTINESYREALQEKEINPAGLISIDPTPYEADKDFSFVATIELFPEVQTATLKGKSVEKPICEVTEKEIAQTLEDLQKRHADYVEKSSVSEKGDRITIDFEGKIDGELFPGGDAKDFPFVLGEGQMLEEFDSALVGTKAGDTKAINFTFPEDYHGKDVAGKAVDFAVKVTKVENPEMPTIDDAFAEKLGITEGGIEKMREEINTSLQRELDNRVRATMRDRVMESLYESNDLEIPKGLVEEEIDRAVKTIEDQLKSQNLPADHIDRENYREEAKKRVALGLIAREVIEQNEIKIDGPTVRARIEEMAEGYDDSEAFVNYYYSDPQRLQQVESVVLEEQVINTMLETADVNEVTVDFREFMNAGQGPQV